MTRHLARACARRPKRTLLAWLGVIVVSIVCVALALDLSSEGDLTGNPESKRAAAIVFQRGLYERRPVDEIVIVRSERYTVAEPEFRAFRARLTAEGRAAGLRAEAAGKSRVSRDRHAVALPLTMLGPIEPLQDVVRSHANDDSVQSHAGDAAFKVSATGDEIVNNDFDELSQHDLEKG